MLFARHEEKETFPFLLLFVSLHLRCLLISKSCTLSLKTMGVCCLEILVFPIQLKFVWGEKKNFSLKAFSELLNLISRAAFATYHFPPPQHLITRITDDNNLVHHAPAFGILIVIKLSTCSPLSVTCYSHSRLRRRRR